MKEGQKMKFFTDFDNYLFHQGTNYESYKKLGAHICEKDGQRGTNFAVWAPYAQWVSIITAPTGWEREIPMEGSEHVSVNGVERAFD